MSVTMLWERLEHRREPEEKALLGKIAGGCGRECSGRLVFVGLRCGTIVVTKIRRNFCQYRMLWERLE
jgi:transposase-like protein